MAFENKLGITDSAQLAREEEKISKAKAKELFESGILDSFDKGPDWVTALVPLESISLSVNTDFALIGRGTITLPPDVFVGRRFLKCPWLPAGRSNRLATMQIR